MFNLLVESTTKTRRRTPRYFLYTFLVYGTIMLGALVGSIMIYRPALADTYESIVMTVPPTPPPAGGGSPQHSVSKQPRQVMSIYEPASNTSDVNVRRVEQAPSIEEAGNFSGGPVGPGGGNGPGTTDGIIGAPSSNINFGDAPKPPVTKPEPVPTPTNDKHEDKIIKVSEGPLLGKAIYIPVPDYPVLAKQVHLEGSVRVELLLDKTGHVVTAKAVSGPPMLCAAAEKAARQASFRPTLLSGEPVMVQAVITFNFRLH
ncbi:MAG TPA: TonB family protein [Blastocatellia bacterium]|nr:TonB family protein [Blastocatellia bacterium]